MLKKSLLLVVLLDDLLLLTRIGNFKRGTDLRSSREEGNEIMDLGHIENKMSVSYQKDNPKMSIASLPVCHINPSQAPTVNELNTGFLYAKFSREKHTMEHTGVPLLFMVINLKWALK